MHLQLVSTALLLPTTALTIVEQTLHKLHRPPPGQSHAEVPERLESAVEALRAAPFGPALSWRRAVDSEAHTAEGAVAALKLVHAVDHLRRVQGLSRSGGGGFDADTYCAPGSWEAILDGCRAWQEATALAAAGRGPTFALCRPAGHHATCNTAMGFGLVNFAAAATAAHLAEHAESQVAILDWDVHHGNGVASLFRDDARVRYCSLHEAGGFPGTGMEESDRGPLGNLLHLPLPKHAGSAAYLDALRHKALPFLLGGDRPQPRLLLVCAGYDALAADPLGTMALCPTDYGESIRMICDDFGFPRNRIALGLEGGYSLCKELGMPAAVVETCAALI